MQGERILFTLNYERFQRILGESNWFKLQQEFKNPLSESFLIWREVEEGGSERWLLVDLGRHSSYSINRRDEKGAAITDEKSNSVVHVSEFPNLENQLKTTSAICNRLQADPQTGYGPQGTRTGFILLLMKLNVGNVYLEGLKRSELSGSKFDFENVHSDLSVVHGMFHEILTSAYDDLINLSDAEIETVRTYLPQFHEIAQKIENFDIGGDNPRDRHADLLKEISDFCSNAKSVLTPTITYLRSKQIDTSKAKFDAFFEDAENKWKEIDDKSGAKLQTLDDLILKQENQLAEISISEYEKIFANQAEKHQTGAKRWFYGTVCLVIVSIAIFVWAIKDLGSATQLSIIVQNVFAKGFLISVFYMLLNRSIKNYTAEKHLEVVNRHRQNALATFEAFADAAGENRDTRDHVLMAATDAIFDANQSGYLSVKTPRSDSANPIQQIVRAVVPDK
ncbi:MAG: hypothetical protein OXD49_10220 [Candidatus Poribacteria bacterium]|nr:hypothetical protein [Candidatus Poribacteria bacterium]